MADLGFPMGTGANVLFGIIFAGSCMRIEKKLDWGAGHLDPPLLLVHAEPQTNHGQFVSHCLDLVFVNLNYLEMQKWYTFNETHTKLKNIK